MDTVCCFYGFYIYLQIMVMFNSWKLLRWEDPKWAWAHTEDKPESLHNFCRGWLITTPIVMFLDVGLLWSGIHLAMGPDWVRVINALPIFVIILMSTYYKTQFIHMCWLVWRVESRKLKKKKD